MFISINECTQGFPHTTLAKSFMFLSESHFRNKSKKLCDVWNFSEIEISKNKFEANWLKKINVIIRKQ